MNVHDNTKLHHPTSESRLPYLVSLQNKHDIVFVLFYSDEYARENSHDTNSDTEEVYQIRDNERGYFQHCNESQQREGLLL